MSQFNASGTKTLLTNAAIAEYLLMKFSAGVWALCGLGERPMASNHGGYAASGAYATGLLNNVPGSRKGVAAGTITAGDILYAAASGKITGAVNGRPIGIALEDAVANDVFEYVMDLNINPITDIGSLAAAGTDNTNGGTIVAAFSTVSAADGTKGVVLPPATAAAECWVYNEHATNGLKVFPAGTNDINDGSAAAAVTIEGKTLAHLKALDTSTWAATFTANS